MFLAVFCLIGNVLSPCINPLIFSKVFDVALPAKNTHLLFILLSIIAVLYLISVITTYFLNILATNMGTTIINNIRLKIFRCTQNLSFKEEESDLEQNLLIQFSDDTNFLEHTLIHTAWTSLQYFLVGVISVCFLFYISVFMSIIAAIIIIPIVYIFPVVFSSRAHKYTHQQRQAEAELFSMEKEAIQSQHMINYLQLKNLKRRDFKSILKNALKFSGFYNINIGLVSKSTTLGVNFLTLFILGVGCFLIIFNKMAIGNLIAFMVLLGNISSVVNNLTTQYPNLVRASISWKRIDEFIHSCREHQPKINMIDIPSIKHNIVFKNVSALSDGKEVVSRISFSIPIGQSIGIVGQSGAGKTSLIKLLLQEIPISEGKILLDGHDLRSVSSRSLYSQIGIVVQNPELFHTTIKENIRLGKLSASDEEIIEAAKAAEIHNDIMALPNGYDTVLHRNGHLSVGQYQRMTIARALIGDKKILCLDEVTSALDPINEDALIKIFKKLKKRLTIIWVSHHLKSVVDMDCIFVMDQGKLVEQGTHADLLKQKQKYFQLWKKQQGVVLSEDENNVKISISWLKSIHLFHSFDNKILGELSKLFSIEKKEENKIIFDEGDNGNKFYIIVSGSVEVSVVVKNTNTRKVLATLSEGDFFGEIALLFDVPRNARITTIGPCVFLILYRDQFHKAFDLLPEKVQQAILEKAKKNLTTQ